MHSIDAMRPVVPVESSTVDRVKAAAREGAIAGVLLGTKWGTLALVAWLVWSFVIGDYRDTKVKANNAVMWIQAFQQQLEKNAQAQSAPTK